MLDKRLLVFRIRNMDEQIMAIRKSGGQYSVTIPLKMAEAAGYKDGKYVIISQSKNGNIKIRRSGVGSSKSGSVPKD